MYRPEEWENPYCAITGGDCAYENGADAMLEALVKNGWLDETDMVDEDPEETE